jgi:flagellar biogenesis protein FliO
MTSYGSYVLETLLTLLAVSVLAFVVLYGARRVGVGRPTPGLELVGRLPIDSRRSVVLVRVARQVYVVGVSEGGLTKLGEILASEFPGTDVGKQSFASVLRGMPGRSEEEEKKKETSGAASTKEGA